MPVHVVDHPLITHKMSIIREKGTSMRKFRDIVSEITLLLTYEATRDLPLHEEKIETPLCETTARTLDEGGRFLVVPILRAGLGMVPGVISLLPLAKVGHIGIQRNEETAEPSTYYQNIPKNIEGTTVFVIDPMLATAGSLCATLDLLKDRKPYSIRAICLIAAPEGRDRVEREHPNVHVYVGAMDERLNEKAYIVPGLGDAGDRMFGTL